jgi:hypothetical protein
MVLALPDMLAAQTVSTVRLSEAMRFDGLYMAADGTLYGANGAEGDRVVRIGEDGDIETIASGLAWPIHMSEDDDGSLVVSVWSNGTLVRVRPGAEPQVVASNLNGPSGVVRGPDGAFYVANWGRAEAPGVATVHRVTPAGDVSVFVERLKSDGVLTSQAIAFDDMGFLYVGDAQDGTLHRVSPDGEVELFLTLFPSSEFRDNPAIVLGNMVHHGGVLYVSTGMRLKVLRVDTQTREVTVLAGNGEQESRDGVGEEASFLNPWGLAISPDGRELWVQDVGPATDIIRRIDLDE